MSNSKSVKKAAALRVIHGTGNPKAATLEDLQGVIETMRVARRNGIDLKVQLHVGATTVDVSNAANEAAGIAAAVAAPVDPEPKPRFTKVSKDGRALAATAAEWEGVYDATTGLIWARSLLPGGERTWKDACEAAGKAQLCGAAARAPTIRERIGITDFERHSPALDTAFFAKESGWEWTSTVDAESPAVCAWVVYLGCGYAYRFDQGLRARVRAVRSGQPIGL